MAIKIGHASADENRRASGGAAGDQTGGEVCTRTWYSSPWDCVLRPKSAEIAEKSAAACEAACANAKIGYDQLSRNTLYHYAKLVGFDLGKISDECECDCSSLMHVCAIAGGAKLGYGVNGMWTGNMEAGFTAGGEYEVLKDAKYLTSDAYLKRGDILLRTSGHTAMALENGALSGEQNPPTANGGTPLSQGGQDAVGRDDPGAPSVTMLATMLPLLERGVESFAVYTLQLLLDEYGYDLGPDGVDGDFGPATEAALMQYQSDHGLERDGQCGSLTWAKLING